MEPGLFLHFRKYRLNWELTFPGLNVFICVSAHYGMAGSGSGVGECCFIRRNVAPLQGDRAQSEVSMWFREWVS